MCDIWEPIRGQNYDITTNEKGLVWLISLLCGDDNVTPMVIKDTLAATFPSGFSDFRYGRDQQADAMSGHGSCVRKMWRKIISWIPINALKYIVFYNCC